MSPFEKAINEDHRDLELIRLPEDHVRNYVRGFESLHEIKAFLENDNDCLKYEKRQRIEVDWELGRIVSRKRRMKKRYKMTLELKGNMETREVWLFGNKLDPKASLKLVNHSPDGFNWGYAGSGPAQLALAICLEIMGPDKALAIYQDFKFLYITRLPQTDFEVDIQIDV
jgi:predicted ribonuclease YlaK